MAQKGTRQSGSTQRRREIIEAALACFSETGYTAASMDDIRTRAGASIGSIYHHFKSKEQLAAAVYLEGILDYQEGMAEKLGVCSDARTGIGIMVEHHIRWVIGNRSWAWFLYTMRHASFMISGEGSIEEANTAFASAVGAFIAPLVGRGILRLLPKEIYISLILGPCQEFSRLYLENGYDGDIDSVIHEIAEAAWKALRT